MSKLACLSCICPMLFPPLSHIMQNKDIMDKDWTPISPIKEYIAPSAESKLCKSWLVIICKL